MPRYELVINGTRHSLDAPEDMPLLWALRDLLGLTGTKFGCGVGICGACTVREGDATLRSCQLSLSQAHGRSFVTIEGLAALPGGSALQDAWLTADVAHCGYCQPGLLLEASALIARGAVDDAALASALDGHLCRCGSYPRLRRAVLLAAAARRNAR